MDAVGGYLVRRGIQLAIAGQDEEAIAVLREAVMVAPESSAAWLNLGMLFNSRGSAEACWAFAEFIRATRADDPLVSFATDVLTNAGREVPVPGQAGSGGSGAATETVQFIVNNGGKRMLMLADNDSGVELEDLITALTQMMECVTWLDAYLFYDSHPELLSGLARTVLDVYAGQDEDRQLTHQAQVNLAMLTRAGEVGLLAAFAEGDQTPSDEFGRLVRAKQEIEPVLVSFNGLSPEEVWLRLDDVPWIARDDDTYLLLARYGEAASDERRTILALLRGMLERHARGEASPDPDGDDHGPGAELAGRLEQLATQETVEHGVAVSEAAGLGTELLQRDDGSVSEFWRVDIARIVAQRWMRQSDATGDLAALDRAENVLDAVSGVPVPGSWQDAVQEVTRASAQIIRYEYTGDMAALAVAAARLAGARGRVGRYRQAEPPILRALASVRTLQGEHAGDDRLLREAAELLTAAERITAREGASWMVNQLAEIRVLLDLTELGDREAISRSADLVEELIQRFGYEPGARGEVVAMAGRVASARYRWTQDVSDLDIAIGHYLSGLEFPETMPSDRTHLHSNLAFALWRRFYLEGEDPADLELARQHGEAALASVPAIAPSATLIRRNLARIYQSLGPAELRWRAIDLFRADLSVLPEGRERTMAAINLALAVLNLAVYGATITRTVQDEAYAAYVEGIESLDPGQTPMDALEAGRAFGLLFLAREGWHAAALAFAKAIDGIDVLAASIPGSRWWLDMQSTLEQTIQLGALCAARSGESEQAVRWLDGHQARALRRALRLDVSALTRLAATGYGDLAQAYASRAAEFRSYGPDTDEGRQNFLARRRKILLDQIDQLAVQIRTIPGFEKFAAAAGTEVLYRASADTDLLYTTVTSLGGLAFLVSGNRQAITTAELPGLDTETVTARASSYLTALDAYRAAPSSADARSSWLTELDSVRSWLWTAFVQPVAAIAANSRPVTIIPSGVLGLLPVTAAQDPASRTPAVDLDDWRYAPSADALLAALEAATRAERETSLAVLDPQPTDFVPLSWAPVELAAVRTLGGGVTSLSGEHATITSVLRAMANHTTLHLACHGAANISEPLSSYLALADNARLTVSMLAEEGRLWGARLCFLSACDSGIAGTANPQEVVALPTALIQLGAAAVIATQWPVSDATAAIFALRFYVARSEGIPPALAFAQTRRWLRNATRTQISILLRKHAADVPGLSDLIAELPLEPVPFSQVQDWAAFTFSGC